MDVMFEVEGRTYHAQLSRGYITINGRERRMTECKLTTTNPIEIFSGITMKNPNDGMEYDELYGYRLAFKRALFNMFVIRKLKHENEVYKKGGVPYPESIAKGWKDILSKFRIPFGKALHQLIKDDSDFPF